jgi:hypothetical protein
MKKEKTMLKTQVGEENAVVSLAFRVVPSKDGLFAQQILLLHDDTVVEKRTGVFTTLGHAIAAADDLMDGWAFSEVEQTPESYFKSVFL